MSFVQTVEVDLTAAGKWLEAEFETEATKVWGVVKTAFLTVEPTLMADVTQIGQLVVSSLGAGAPMSQIMTSVLNVAESLGKTAVKDVESNLLSGMVSLVIAAAQPPAAPKAP